MWSTSLVSLWVGATNSNSPSSDFIGASPHLGKFIGHRHSCSGDMKFVSFHVTLEIKCFKFVTWSCVTMSFYRWNFTATISFFMIWSHLFGSFPAKQIEMFSDRVSRSNIWLLAGLSWQFKRCFCHLYSC